jgi:hypothetical protein
MCMQCILDDMIISGATDQEYLDNLEEVLSSVDLVNMVLERTAVSANSSRKESSGHEISKLGLHKSQQRVNAVINVPRPENVSQVRSFVGLINYYHNFLPNLFTFRYGFLWQIIKFNSIQIYIYNQHSFQAINHHEIQKNPIRLLR